MSLKYRQQISDRMQITLIDNICRKQVPTGLKISSGLTKLMNGFLLC